MLFRSATLSGDVRSSNTFDVILSVPVPAPNSLLWMSKAGITNSWLVLLPNVVSQSRCFVYSSSRSSHRQISLILYLSSFLSVSLGLIPRKNPMLASFWELYFSILRKERFARSVSMITLVELYRDQYFSCDKVNVDSSVTEMYILFFHFTQSLIGERNIVFFVFGECVSICNSDAIVCNNGSSLIHLFNRFKYILVYFCILQCIYCFLSLWWLHTQCGDYIWCFCYLPSLPSWSVMLLILPFISFVSITRSEMEL